MKKKLTALLVGAALMLAAGSAWAIPSEWGILNPTSITGAPSIAPATDFGYYIWTDDVERTSWHMRMVDGAHPGTTLFTGTIALENNNGVFASFSFEGADLLASSLTGAAYFSYIANGIDGIDFTITQTAAPSYVGFDLFYQLNGMDAKNIFLGGIEQTVFSLGGDQDFAIAAPVPEPGTMVLLGAGLLGLAIFGKRRMNKEA